MCDLEKYRKIYKEIDKLDADDTLELILNSQDSDEQDFFELIGNFLLQKKQKKVIQENRF